MPQFSLPAQDMTRAVTSLGQALFPSGAGQIQGQLDGAQFNQRMAAANQSNAHARLYGAQADRSAFELQGAQSVRDLFTNGAQAGVPLSPEAQAALFGNLLTMDGDPEAAVRAGVGANIAISPQQYSQPDLSNVLIGTGIQNDFADTPTGFNATLAEDARQADNALLLDEISMMEGELTDRRGQDLDHGGGGPGRVAPLGIDEAITVAEQFAAQATQLNLDLDDAEMAAAGQRVVDLYNTQGDVATAINQTLREFMEAEQMAADNRSGGFFGLGASTPSSLDYVPFDVEQLGQPAAQAAANGPAATPAVDQQALAQVWASTSPNPPSEGDTLRDQNGVPIYVFTAGQFVPFTQSAVSSTNAIPRQYGPPYSPPTQEDQRRGDRQPRPAAPTAQPTRRGDRRVRRDETQGAESLGSIFSGGGTSYERNPRRGQ